MYQGKHLNKNKRRRRRNRQKATMLLTSLVLLLTLLIGGTVAFMIATANSAENVFMESTVSCEVQETFYENENENVKSDVTIKNTGDTAAYIRAAIVVTWKDAENGNVYAGKPEAGTDYKIDLNGTGWIEGNDGYYYHIEPVVPGGSTGILITRCTPVTANVPEGYGLNVEILGSAIQSVPVKVVEDHWPAVQVVDDEPHGDLAKAN